MDVRKLRIDATIVAGGEFAPTIGGAKRMRQSQRSPPRYSEAAWDDHGGGAVNVCREGRSGLSILEPQSPQRGSLGDV